MANATGSMLPSSAIAPNHSDTRQLERMSSSPNRHAPGAYVHKPYMSASAVPAKHGETKGLEQRAGQLTQVRNIRMPVDASCGHCFPPTVPCSGSMSTLSDQFLQVRVTDCYIFHCCGPVCHGRVASQGSRTTYSDMLPKHCHTHAISCGDFACNGSFDAMTGY